MEPDRARLDALLAALARRERRLLAARAALQGAAGALAVALVAVLLALARLPQALGLGLLALAALALPLGSLLAPVAQGWRAAGDRVRQARLVEGLRPALRGRLVTLAERPGGAGTGESEALLALAARRAAGTVAGLGAAEVHSARPVRRAFAVTLGVAAVVTLTAALGPTTPSAALRALLGGAPPTAAAPPPAPAAEPDAAVIGDVVLRYRYPAYTRLDPVEVPNSTGDVHAPPGTFVEVRARTAVPWERADLVVEREARGAEPAGSDSAPAALEGGRSLSAGFELRAAGTWRFALGSGPATQDTRRHAIAVDEDLAPEVLLVAPEGVVEVAWDQPLPATWSVRDDYGVARVEARAEGQDGAGARDLRRPLDAPRRLEGALDATPQELGLLPGSEGRVVLVAWDNDAVGGSKAGRSHPLRVRVLGPRGESQRQQRVVRELRDALLLVLAAHLEDPWPPDGDRVALRAWGAGAVRRMDGVEQIAERAWLGYEPEGFEGTVIEAVRRAQGSLVGFVQALGTAPGAPPGEDLATLDALRGGLVEALEQGVLTLDQVVRAAALAALEEEVAALRPEADTLAGMAIAQRVGLLARLDRLERHLGRVERAAAEAGDARQAAIVRQRVRGIEGVGASLRRALAAAPTAPAELARTRLVRDLRDLVAEFERVAQQRQEEEDELAARVEALHTELVALRDAEKAELDLLLGALARAGGPRGAVADRWEALEQRAGAVASALRDLATVLGVPDRPVSERRQAELAAAEAGKLAEALEARDLGRALEGTAEVEWALSRLQATVERHAAADALLGRPVPDGAAVRAGVEAAGREAGTLRTGLDALLRELAAEPSALRADTAPLAPAQAGLAERTAAAAREAAAVARHLPMQAPGLAASVAQADGEARAAAGALPEGRAREAEAAERAAILALEEAIRALEQAMGDAAAMARAARGRSGRGGEPRDGEGRRSQGQEVHERASVEIPAPEEFRTPEAYRRALLEGMQAEVPAEYEALERSYYEELVRQ